MTRLPGNCKCLARPAQRGRRRSFAGWEWLLPRRAEIDGKGRKRSVHRLTAIALLAVGTAFAHSRTEGSFPEDGAFLSVSPDVVSLSFDTPTRITMIRLTGEAGDTFELRHSHAMEPVTEFRATPPPLPNGRYLVEWRGLAADGHPLRGRFSFEVAR